MKTMLRIVIPTNKLLIIIREKLFALDIIAENLNTKFNVHIQFNNSLNLRNFEIIYKNLNITFDQTKPVVETAEENLLVALKNSVNFGGWTWILGDDDYFNLELIHKILEACEASSLGETYSVISLTNNLFNDHHSPVFSDNGITNKNDIINVQNFILFNGLISATAGFSNWILYLTPKDIAELEEILKRKIKIYWHIPWILSIAFHLNAIRRIELPRLQYSLNAHDNDGSNHWRNYTEKVGVAEHSPWGENLIDLIFSVCNDNFFKQTETKFITERDAYGNKYNLGEFITSRTLSEISWYLNNSKLDKARALSSKLIMFAYRLNLFPGPVLFALFKLTDVETLEEYKFKKRKIEFLDLISRYKTEFGAFNYTWMVYWSDKSIVFNYFGCEIVIHRECHLKTKHEDFINFYYQNLHKETLFTPLCFCDQENLTELTRKYGSKTNLRSSNLYKIYKTLPFFLRNYLKKQAGLN